MVMPIMAFQNNTPQTIRGCVAMQELRQTLKRKSAHASDTEPPSKKQKLHHRSLPSAPAQFQVISTTCLSLTDDRPNLVDGFLPPAPARAQAHDMTNLGPNVENRQPNYHSVTPVHPNCLPNPELAIQKPNLDHSSLFPIEAQAHDMTDLGAATKQSKLSYHSLTPAQIYDRTSSVGSVHTEAEFYRERHQRWCEFHGFDNHLLVQSTSTDTSLMSSNSDLHKDTGTQSSKNRSYAYGPSALDVYPVDDSTAKNLIAESPEVNTHHTRIQKLHDLSHHIPPHDAAAQLRPIADEVHLHYTPAAQGPIRKPHPGSGEGISHSPPIQNTTTQASPTFGGESIESFPSLRNQSSTSLSSLTPALESPASSSYPNKVSNNTVTISDQVVSLGSDHDVGEKTAAASSGHIAPLSLDSMLRDNTTPTSSCEVSSAGPPRNKGGRPKGRKPRAPKKPKGPTRFQKNHPVKAKVNMDVWENILIFCPPDFLLKARTISTTFRSALKDDSLIWKRARVNHFGPDIPDPPSGLSEPQYVDLLTSVGCQTHGCESKKTRKTYWAFQRRLCIECFQKAFVPPRALRRAFKELDTSETPQYRSIGQYYRRMDEFLPGMKFDRWDNYQWLGDYDPTPTWGQLYRSGQYTGYPTATYVKFSTELALFVGNEYDKEQGRFFSNEPMPGKICPSQEAISTWFEAKRAANDALVPMLQAVENWYESCKRDNQKVGKDLRKSRESFYEEQAELAGLNSAGLKHFIAYQAAIAISKPATMQSWKILLPKLLAEHDEIKRLVAEKQAERALERNDTPNAACGGGEGTQQAYTEETTRSDSASAIVTAGTNSSGQ